MKEFTFRIEELLARDVVINAETQQEALDKLQEQYDDCQYVLDEHDFFSKEFIFVEEK